MIGTRRMVLQMRCSPRTTQNGRDFRSRRSSGRSRGMRYRPIFEVLRDASHVRPGQHGEVRAPIAIDEIEDVVAARLRARAERRPGDGRHRRERRLQPAIRARLLECLEVGQVPVRHEPIGERGVLAIEPDDDEPSDAGTRRSASAQPPPQHPERPEEQRGQRRNERREEHEERREQREAGAGTDVCVGRLRRDERQDDQRRENCRGTSR